MDPFNVPYVGLWNPYGYGPPGTGEVDPAAVPRAPVGMAPVGMAPVAMAAHSYPPLPRERREAPSSSPALWNLPIRSYLDQTVVPVLMDGMAELVKVR